MSRRFELTFPDPLWERMEGARGHEPRASFVKRAVEAALDRRPEFPVNEDDGLTAPQARVVETSRPQAEERPASPRASVEAESVTTRGPMGPAQAAPGPVERIGCPAHPDAGALRGTNGRWWCAADGCYESAQEIPA